MNARDHYPRKKKLVVVLGYRLLPDGTPHHILKERVAHACEIWTQAKNAEKPLLVMCGGKTAGQHHASEAEVMQDIARRYQVRSNDILLETKSLTTEGNAVEARRLGINNVTYNPIVLVTSNDHMSRAQRIFQNYGIRTRRSPCDNETKAVVPSDY